MIVLSLAMLAFAVADLLRWSPEPVSPLRTIIAGLGALVIVLALATLSDLPPRETAIVCAATIVAVGIWLSFDHATGGRSDAGWQLGWISTTLLCAFALSGQSAGISGPLAHWYSRLPFPFVGSVGIEQFLLGASVALFLLATANRIVRLVLIAAGTPATKSEPKLKGGRLLGPMERLFVAGMTLSGNLTGAAVIIAAKGLLRLPEIRSDVDQAQGHDDQITEYFLIGTFCSLLLAGGLATLILG